MAVLAGALSQTVDDAPPKGQIQTRIALSVNGAANDTSAPILLQKASPATVGVVPGTGASVKAQYTSTPHALIGSDGAGAVWEDWAAGVVTAAKTSQLPGPATAVRLMQTVAGTTPCSIHVVE